jgi:hypothetical protein
MHENVTKMGRHDPVEKIPFTQEHVKQRDLVIRMLKFEEETTKSEFGQSLYANHLNNPFVSLTVEKTLNRITLSHFGFSTDDDSVENYRTIFGTYFESPEVYDKEVVDSVHYIRENKCVFYKKPDIKFGQVIPNCALYNLKSGSQEQLHDIINFANTNYAMLCPFSLS